QSVSLTCAGAPALSTCTVSPAALTPDGTNPKTVTVQVTTTARASLLPTSPFYQLPLGEWTIQRWFVWSVAAFAFFVALSLGQMRRHTRTVLLFTGVLLAILTFGCGGGRGVTGGGGSSGNPGTPAGTSTLTVSGSSGILAHNTSVTLTVN
ncbi:MAG TPA: hypothetical protein VHW72_18760, partial [Candidatus Angelobacter sp.]|nr:hypothetical protein [Candidatus Angelobacter sp.]